MAKDEFTALHVRVPKDLYLYLLKERDRLRKTKPMSTLSHAVREVLERGRELR